MLEALLEPRVNVTTVRCPPHANMLPRIAICLNVQRGPLSMFTDLHAAYVLGGSVKYALGPLRQHGPRLLAPSVNIQCDDNRSA